MKGVIRGHGEKTTYWIDGRQVTKGEFDAAFPDKPLKSDDLMTPFPGNWPMHSDAMEVHPKQLELAKKLDRQRGAPPTEYDSLNRPIWTSEAHKRKYIRAHGVHDNNSYLG